MFGTLKFPKLSQKSLLEAFFTIGGRIVSVFIVIAATKFLTTFLSEAAYGQLALYSITATLPSTFFFGPLGQGIMRLFPVAKEKNELAPFHHQYLRLYRRGAGFILGAGVVAAFICWFSGETKWAIASLLIAVYNVFNALNYFQYGLQNAARKRILALGLETGDRVLQQSLAIGLLLWVSGDPLMVISGYLLAALVFSLVNHHYYQKSFPEIASPPAFEPKGRYSNDILQYSWPFIVFGIFFWFQNASDRWGLELLRSTESVGQYAVLNQIGFQSLTLIFGSIGYFLIPILFNKAGGLQNSQRVEEANQANNLFLWFNALLTFFLFVLFWFFGEEVVRLLSDEKYVEVVAPLLPFMVLAGGLFNFGQNYSNRFMLSMQTNLLLTPKILAAVVGCALNIAAAIFYGLPGLAAALILTQAIYVISLVIMWQWIGSGMLISK